MVEATLPLLKPDLYSIDATGAPLLLGGRCECGHVFFPMQTFGCERCGRNGTALQPYALTACGELRAAATVHVHSDDKRKAPFVIGTIALDDGPVIRTLLDASDDASRGSRVEGILMRVAHEGSEILDLRFRPVRQ